MPIISVGDNENNRLKRNAKITTHFANVARTTASTSKFIY